MSNPTIETLSWHSNNFHGNRSHNDRSHGDRFGTLRMIDQTLLPTEVTVIECTNVEAVWEAIKMLRVRGAPAIGIAAAYGVCIGLQTLPSDADLTTFSNRLDEVTNYLASSRPTAVNLFWALDRMKAKAETLCKTKSVPEVWEALFAEAKAIHEEDRHICRAIGRFGQELVKDGSTWLTHCNAGGLATADYGTALAVFFAAKEAGKTVHVYADETRPLLQGARLTAWELMQRGIDVTLICDSMAALVMRESCRRNTESACVGKSDRHTESACVGKSDRHTESACVGKSDRHTESACVDKSDRHTESACVDKSDRRTESACVDKSDRRRKIDGVVVGADRIAANGDVANKVGTYGVAVLAKAHNVPFYVAAPISTFDLSLSDGTKIPIEERDDDEICNGFGKRTAPEGVNVYNPAFDVTPAELIAGIITERGIISPVNRHNIEKIVAPV